MANLCLDRVSKSFGVGRPAVDDVSFDVPDGCFCVILGPSGCGKSTLLRMVAGLEVVSSGRIRLGSDEINAWHPKDRDMAMVFQNYALYPHLTVAENVAFPLAMRKTPKAEAHSRVVEVASMLQISDLLSRRPSQLSGGQRQRVALARAIVRKPKAFLFDEPLSNLDASMRLRTRTELKALHHQLRVTSLYVTHDQEEAMGLADQVVVMAGGRLRQCAPPLDVYERPADRFVAGFVGSPPMNFIDVVIRPGAEVHAGTAVRARAAGASVPTSGPAVLGVRPSHLSITPNAGDLANAMGAVIRSVEPLGEFVDVQVDVDGVRLSARVPARRDLSVGQRVSCSIDYSRAHLFEPGADGRRIECELAPFDNPARRQPDERRQPAIA